MSCSRVLAVLGLIASLPSCTGRSTTASGDPGKTASPVTDGGSLALSGQDGAAGGLAVSLPASVEVACPGACVSLSPTIAGGVPPYTVHWSDGAMGAGAHQVCPTSTTTYTATVTDASGHGGELGGGPRQTSASTTVTVAGTSCSAAMEAGAKDGGGSEGASGDGSLADGATTACTAFFTSSDWWSSGTQLRDNATAVAVDPSGNLLVTADFGSGYVGDLSVPQGAGNAVMVAKFDPHCHLLWSREYASTGADIITTVIAADASGNVIVGGMFETANSFPFPAADLGSGSIVSTNWRAFATKLDPTGKTLWVYAAPAPSGAAPGETTSDLAIDSSGNVVLAMSGIPNGTGYSVVKVDSSGQQVFIQPTSTFAATSDVMQSVAVASDGSIWSVATNPTTGDMTLAHLGADASVLATQTVSAPTTPQDDVGAAVRIGPTGDMVLSWAAHATAYTYERWLRDYDSSGNVRWSTSFDLYGGFNAAQLARLDVDGNAWITDFLSSLGGSQSLPIATLTSANGAVEVLQVGIDGGFRSADLLPPVTTDAGAIAPAVGDMALGPGRTMVIAGWTNPTGFMVTKLQL